MQAGHPKSNFPSPRLDPLKVAHAGGRFFRDLRLLEPFFRHGPSRPPTPRNPRLSVSRAECGSEHVALPLLQDEALPKLRESWPVATKRPTRQSDWPKTTWTLRSSTFNRVKEVFLILRSRMYSVRNRKSKASVRSGLRTSTIRSSARLMWSSVGTGHPAAEASEFELPRRADFGFS
jgi:hypothetical protein